MSLPLPPSIPPVQLCPRSSHLYKCCPVTPRSPKLWLAATTLPQNTPFCVTLMSLTICLSPLSLSLCLSTERYLVWAVLLCCIQGNEPHALHRLRPAGPGESFRHLAHHAEHDCRSDLLRCFHRPRNGSYPVLGLLQTAVSGKGEELLCALCSMFSNLLFLLTSHHSVSPFF